MLLGFHILPTSTYVGKKQRLHSRSYSDSRKVPQRRSQSLTICPWFRVWHRPDAPDTGFGRCGSIANNQFHCYSTHFAAPYADIDLFDFTAIDYNSLILRPPLTKKTHSRYAVGLLTRHASQARGESLSCLSISPFLASRPSQPAQFPRNCCCCTAQAGLPRFRDLSNLRCPALQSWVLRCRLLPRCLPYSLPTWFARSVIPLGNRPRLSRIPGQGPSPCR
ncbi:hypothetical protein B0H63DRAFT_150205 [Podospora didyma]|uniref:Uncharacterized protein n=1 Tax=Podospora didyma TaxID=330526 RepID=A0AAE0U174_9PEZI|nr:hypothetical protein B0H63DRAFT_150205 [Podospora didyma]